MPKFSASVDVTHAKNANYTVEAQDEGDAYGQIDKLARDEFPDADTLEIGEILDGEGAETGEVAHVIEDAEVNDVIINFNGEDQPDYPTLGFMD